MGAVAPYSEWLPIRFQLLPTWPTEGRRVFLIGQINTSVKLIFLITVRSRTLKSVQFK
jgi:hypothetical protein